MLAHLSEPAVEALLGLFNKVWVTGNIPEAWKKAIIIPFLKPGKPPTSPSSYRPIALTSCLAKTFESVLNIRLTFVLEVRELLDIHQCGFKKACSTTDHLVRFENTVREAFIHKQHCLAVFFDLEKAYDTTWRFGILKDLAELGIRGRMLNCLKDFLSNRSFHVRLGSTLSKNFIQENGVPQGCILSTTLFVVKMNSISKIIPRSIMYSVYVDDLQIACTSSNISTCERQVQLTINKLATWADRNGFRFSPQKTVAILFSLKRGLQTDPTLHLNETELPVQNEHKYLGITFDKKLTFVPHINALKKKASRSLNILKVLSHKHWGSDRLCLLQIYRSVIRSRLDYGSIVYGSARKSYLNRLDPVHNLGLRLSTGAYKTSPINSLYVETNEPPLSDRRTMLTCSYILKIRSLPKHICYQIVTRCPSRTLFTNKPHAIRPLLLRFEERCQELDIMDTLPHIAQNPDPLPPWYSLPSVCDFTLTQSQKKQTPHEHILQEYLALNEKYAEHSAFYTDGSKTAGYVGSAVIQGNWEKTVRLPQCASIFTAECYAVSVAVEKIINENIENSIIYTDSLSVLTALQPRNAITPLIGNILHNIRRATSQGHNIKFCWVPSHVGISGNEKADECAAKARHKEIINVRIPYKDSMKLVFHKLRNKWQSTWKKEVNNKLHLVKPNIEEWKSCSHQKRFIEVILCRLRIGHTHLTHNFLLTKQDKPVCEKCGDELTVIHILISCTKLETLRKKYFTLFYNEHIPFHPSLILGEDALVNMAYVFSFLREAGVLEKL